MQDDTITVSHALTILRQDLEGRYFDDLTRGRVQANIKKMLAEDLRQKAHALARRHRVEVYEQVEAQVAASSEAALTTQITRALVRFEANQDVNWLPSQRGRQERTLANELARAHRVYEWSHDPELGRLIKEWTAMARSIPETARHLARLPLITSGDPDLLMLSAGGPKQRQDAVTALIEKGFVSIQPWLDKSNKHGRAKAELSELAKDKGWFWVRDWLQTRILPSALVLAADELTNGNAVRVRLGKKWILDIDGRASALPPRHLGDSELQGWLKQRAYQLVDEAIAGPEDVAISHAQSLSRFPSVSEADAESQRLEDRLASEDRSPLDELTNRQEERESEKIKVRRLLRVMDHINSLSTADYELVQMRVEGRPYSEIVQLVGGTVAAARKRCERLKKAIRKLDS